MTTISAKSIRVFMAIEKFKQEDSNILYALLPFLEQALEEQNGDIFDTNRFAASVASLYGWRFSAEIAEEFVPLFEEKGWLNAQAIGRSGSVYTVNHTPPEVQIDADIKDKLDAIARDFSNYLAKISPLQSYSKSEDDLLDILIEWLVATESYTEDILNYTVRNIERPSGKIVREVTFPNTSRIDDDGRYLAAMYVSHLIKTGDKKVSDLCQIAGIGLLTEVVQDFHRPTAQISNTSLIVYLDAPLAMEILGVSGKAAQANLEKIVTEFQEIGGQVKVLSVSLDEIRGALTAVLNRSPSDRTGPTADALRKGDVLPPYVQRVAQNPRKYLEHLGFEIDETQRDHKPSSHQYFSEDQADDFENCMRFHPEPQRRTYDANVVARVMRVRANHTSHDIFQSRSIMLTANEALVAYTRRFCKERSLARTDAESPVIHRRQFATAIWLRTGLNRSSSEIPKRNLMASCEKVLRINKTLPQEVKTACSALNPSTTQQLELLLSEDRSVQYLQSKFLGNVRAISAQEPELLLKTLEEGLTAKIQQESKDEIRRIERETNTQLKHAEQQNKKMEEQSNSTKAQLHTRNKEDATIVSQFEKEMKLCGICIRRGVAISALILLSLSYLLEILNSETNPPFVSIAFSFLLLCSYLVTFSDFLNISFNLHSISETLLTRRFERTVDERALGPKLRSYKPSFKQGRFSLEKIDNP